MLVRRSHWTWSTDGDRGFTPAIPPGNGLSYVLNDEEAAGGIVAQRIGALLNGQGTVALLGLNPDILGVATGLAAWNSISAPNFQMIMWWSSAHVRLCAP